ncbi:DNA polymerase delta subunit 3-like [Macrosteles quadrilineatus]|uniref:DNA polymerase delta subunit 3-like n=1 Tax=Macrosteles quadrilineatus TaxID=74068 RepID=UPI0023E1827E|nr:DNA polymerase delta subunit 3-like [Macrosteles quadrilineatus]
MTEGIDSYLANIEEYVFDEKKIVTCSWLSKSLGLHTNLSKQLLHLFFERCPKKDELSLTYLLIGSPDNDGRCKISIVKDKDLDKCESSWKLITSKHIYSVQKCTDLSDLNVLYTAQKEDSAETLSKGISAIDFNCNERDTSLIAKLRSDALPVPSKQPLGASKKPVSQPPAKSKSPAKNKGDNGSEENKAAASKDKGSVIPSMFKNNKPTESKTNSTTTKKPAEKPSVGNKKPQGIGAFFSKSTNKQTSEPKKVEEEKKIKEEQESNSTERHSPSKENKQTLNIVTEDKIEKKSEEDDKTNASETSQKPSPKNKKLAAKIKPKATAKKENSKKGRGKKNEKEQKKRKRVTMLSDSESENSSGGEEEETREPTPEPQPTIIPDDDDDMVCGTPEPATRKRKRKLVAKTYKTPDGYMMTKKEYESYSEEEEETVPEKKAKGNSQNEESAKSGKDIVVPATTTTNTNKNVPKPTKASPHKTKQASLTSFFKKK